MAESSADNPEVRVIMWSLPRTISTALTKCLSFIDGIKVWLEPYGYAHAAWLCVNASLQQDLPTEYEGNEAMFAQAAEMLSAFTHANIEPDRLAFSRVKMDLENSTARYVFVKDQSHAMNLQFRSFLPQGFKHVFLIRDPTSVFVSYRKAMYKQLTEMGSLSGKSMEDYDIIADDPLQLMPASLFENHHSLWKHVQKDIDSNPIVIDSNDVLTNPKKILKALLDASGLPYADSLLKWPASVDHLRAWITPGQGILEGHVNFYGNAMKSTHFMPPPDHGPRDRLSSDVIRCVDVSMPFYQEMYEARIK